MRAELGALLAGILLPALFGAAPATAFSVLIPGFGARSTLEETARWDANPGAPASLADGLQVAIEPGFLAAIGVTDPGLVPVVEAGLQASFAAWENGGLEFDIPFDGPVVDGRLAGAEMDVFALSGDDPRLCGSIAGCAWWQYEWSNTRMLTNGEVVPGYAILGVDIYMHIETFTSLFAVAGSGALAIFQRTLIHEVGHGGPAPIS